MEKVQFQLEATLPEIKDLREKGLFSKNELDRITSKRTQFETALIRRAPRPEDFYRYAEYEINLERLRKVRWKRLGFENDRPPPSASTYSIPRRVVYILKRATMKFPHDVSVWLAYVDYARREGMRKVVGKALTSALQQHPTSATLYLLLSQHYLYPTLTSPTDASSSAFSIEGTSPARTTLLRGLRLVPGSHDLWREYIKLELGWIEALRRRWRVLGLVKDIKAESSGAGADGEGFVEDAAVLAGGEGAFGPEGEPARKAILAGQLVLTAIEGALAAMKDYGFTLSLVTLLRRYPTPLRLSLLNAVYERIGKQKDDPRVVLLLLTRGLYDRAYVSGEEVAEVVLGGVELVDALGRIAPQLKETKDKPVGWGDVAAEWLLQWINAVDDENMRAYLSATLNALTKPAAKPSASLLLTHLDFLATSKSTGLLKTARAHAAQHPSSASLQSLRMKIEATETPNEAQLHSTWQTVIKAVGRSHALDVTALWEQWLMWESLRTTIDRTEKDRIWRAALAESMRSSTDSTQSSEATDDLHSILLAQYLVFQLQEPSINPISALAAITSGYLPTPTFFKRAFATLPAEREVLSALYQSWRRACKTHTARIEAVEQWASWLLENGGARDAEKAVEVVLGEVGAGSVEGLRLEQAWKAMLMRLESSEDSESDVEMDE